MNYLLYLMFRCDRRCDGYNGKFENLVGTKHTHGGKEECSEAHSGMSAEFNAGSRWLRFGTAAHGRGRSSSMPAGDGEQP